MGSKYRGNVTIGADSDNVADQLVDFLTSQEQTIFVKDSAGYSYEVPSLAHATSGASDLGSGGGIDPSVILQLNESINSAQSAAEGASGYANSAYVRAEEAYALAQSAASGAGTGSSTPITGLSDQVPRRLLVDTGIQSTAYLGDTVSGSYGSTGGVGATRFFTNGPYPQGLALTEAGARSGTFSATGDYSYLINVEDSVGNRGFFMERVGVGMLVNVSGTAGTAYNKHQTPSATYTSTGGVEPYTYALSGTIPPGISLNSNGVYGGSFTASGDYSYEVVSTDANGHYGYIVENVMIAPIVMTITNPQGNVITGQAASGSYNVSGNGTAPYSYTASGLPAGMTVTTAGVRSGTLSASGSYNVTVTCTDANNETCTLVDSFLVGTMLLTSEPTTGLVGQPFKWTLTPTGVFVEPISISAISGLPSWLTDSVSASSVEFSGTPTASGESSVPITIKDSAGQSVSITLTFTVNPANLTITGAYGPATQNTAVTGAYVASEGTPPYTFSIAGPLPTGMSVDASGNRSGTFTATGTYTFTVDAIDSYGSTGSLSDTITVSVPTYAAWNPAVANAEITVSNGVHTNSLASYNTSGTNQAMVITDTSFSTKTYVEFVLKVPAGATAPAGVGFSSSIPDVQYGHNVIGNTGSTAGIYAPSGTLYQDYGVYSVTLANDGTTNEYRFGLAVDPVTGEWWATDNGTSWVNDQAGTAGNPADPTTTLPKPTAATPSYFGGSPGASGNTVEIISDPSLMKWNAPAGFTKGLVKS